MSLQGKHALITGSSRGISRGIALKLAELGANVAINYYENESAASETLARVRDAHPKALLCGIREAARLMPDGGAWSRLPMRPVAAQAVGNPIWHKGQRRLP